MTKDKLVGVISLGCDKNRTDTEKMLAILSERHTVTDDVEKAQIIIVNTCAFLKSSRKEAVSEILWAAELKKYGVLEKLIVTGCLPQKFVDEIFGELVEVDAFLGVSDYLDILSVIDRVYLGERVNAVGLPRSWQCPARIKTTPFYAYLKIADGCSNFCTYCLIPKIRGKYRSVPSEKLIEEAKGLGQVNELILVAQDLTRYGEDLDEDVNLTKLIKKLSKLDNICHIRLLYCYPEGVTDELIEEIRHNDKVLKYIDIPFQHADDRVLKRMNRKGSCKGYIELVNKLKAKIPAVAIRSTFITGFPGESEEAFENLCGFLQEAKLFNAGFFKYSREEDTPAYKLDGQLLESVKNKRLKKLYSVQKGVVKANLKELVGKTITVLAEGFDQNELIYYGRAYFNAPDIDGKVFFFSRDEVEYGKEVTVTVKRVCGYDLYGERQ
ncbi:MAG: 30S ribosomal protein S12 methylthiotransferase RimO [Clostridiales bacterium]|nr:30S ribosomal protein S12 methylthiotransferase RimO [Clostridiales bacterium]